MCLTENIAAVAVGAVLGRRRLRPVRLRRHRDRRGGAALGRVRRRRRRSRFAPAPAARRGQGDRQPRLEQRVLPHRIGRRRPQPRSRRGARRGPGWSGATCSRELHRLATNRRGELRRAQPGVRRSRRRRRRAARRCRRPITSSCSSPAAAGCTRRCSRRGRPAPTPTRSSTNASRSIRPARSRPQWTAPSRKSRAADHEGLNATTTRHQQERATTSLTVATADGQLMSVGST